MIDHNIVRFNISVHNALAMTEIKGFKHFKDIEANIEIAERRIESAVIYVIDILKYKTGAARSRVPDYVQKLNYVRSST